MKFTELTVLLPCHSLEDFPVYHEGAQADELLAAWCCAVASGPVGQRRRRARLASHRRAARDALGPADRPRPRSASIACRPALWPAPRTKGAGSFTRPRRDAAVAAALAGLDGGDAGVDGALAADFLALGFCRLQIELLTRQMRYSTNIDETHFQQRSRGRRPGRRGPRRAHGARAFAAMLRHALRVPQTLLSGRCLPDRPDAAGREHPGPIASRRAGQRRRRPTCLATAALLRANLGRSRPPGRACWPAIDGGTACVVGRRTRRARVAAVAAGSRPWPACAPACASTKPCWAAGRGSTPAAAPVCGRRCRNC